MSNLSSKIAATAPLLFLVSLAHAEASVPRVFSPADKPPASPAMTAELLALGKRVYVGACSGCHGESGDGKGREGALLDIPPRDLTKGVFFFRSTPGGTLPLDADLRVSPHVDRSFRRILITRFGGLDRPFRPS